MQATGRQNAAERGLSQESEAVIPQTTDIANKGTSRKQALLGPLSLFGWYAPTPITYCLTATSTKVKSIKINDTKLK